MFRSLKSPRLLVAIAGLAGGATASVVGLGMLSANADTSASVPAATFEMPANVRSFADVVEQVSPAVVKIDVTQVAEMVPAGGMPGRPGHPGGPQFDDFFERFFGNQGMPRPERPMRGQGSGFVIDEGGYIVTNNHVVNGAEEINVSFIDGRELEATLVGVDPQTDLALLKVESDEDLPWLRFGDSDEARVGDWVLAIGNPFGLGGTATAGIISARGRDIQSGPYDDYLQIDAPINSGNSGGPVFNADGEVIGVNTAIFSPNGGNVGIGFAIPASQVEAIVSELKSSGTVERGWLGVQIQDVDEELAASFGLEDAAGVAVAEVVEDSPAQEAGIEVGDVILRFGEKTIDDARGLSRTVAATDPEDEVKVVLWREGKEKTVRVTLGKSDVGNAVAAAQGGQGEASGESLGLGLANLDDNYRSRLGLPADTEGVVVTHVQPGSPAAEEGLRPGDIVSRIDSVKIEKVEDAVRATADAREDKDRVTLLIRRGDAQRFVSVALS